MTFNGRVELFNFFDSVMHSPLGEPDYDEREYGFSDDERNVLWERELELLGDYASWSSTLDDCVRELGVEV